MNRNYTIMVCGASRVGKSTLINAIVGKEVAQTSSSLKSCTDKIAEYVLERHINVDDHRSDYTIKIWDTPGIESWSEKHVRPYFDRLVKETNPVCVIYCASPGSFLDKQQLKWFVEQCMDRGIFVALVCTNMFAANRCAIVMAEFVELMTSIDPLFTRHQDGSIQYFGQKALCTMVNSKPYVDEDWGVSKGAAGVEELIFGIARCLSDEQQLYWLQAVVHNQSFWTKMGSSVSSIIRMPFDTLSHISNQTCGVARYLLSIMLPTSVVVENERSSASTTNRLSATPKRAEKDTNKRSDKSKKNKIVSYLRTLRSSHVESAGHEPR